MFEAKITIETPGLSQAINRLADAMAYPAAHAASLTVQPAPVTPPAPAPAAPTAAPVASPAPPVPATPPVTPPLAPAPGFTLEQISRAGADFITANPGKYQELVTLFGQFGISTVDQLKPEQYGAFATALRGLGAKL